MDKFLELSETILVKQGSDNTYDFYLSQLTAKEIIEFSNIIRLSEDPEQGVQRFLDNKRVNSIAEYCETENAIFPTPIILTMNSDFAEISEHTLKVKKNEDFIKDFGKPFSIIDGQHRIEGIKKYYENNMNKGDKDFKLPVIIYLDADQSKAASIFITINANQRSVDSSLIHQLFGIIYKNVNRYTVQSFSNQVTKILNESQGSPFNNAIKMLGRKKNGSEFISQGTIAKKVTERITSNVSEDNLKIERGYSLKRNDKKIFRDFFIDNEPVLVSKILLNFFKAFSETFSDLWNTEDYITKKAVGFSALMKLLDYIYNDTENLTENNFRYYFSKLKNKYYADISEMFKSNASSESVATNISKELIEMLKNIDSINEEEL